VEQVSFNEQVISMCITVSIRKKTLDRMKTTATFTITDFFVQRVVETIVLHFFYRCTRFIPVYSDCLLISKCIS